MGCSRGGLTSKIHALVDADGRPVALRLTGGQVHDSQEAEALLDAMPEGATLLADKGYDSNAIREAAARKNVWANIPSRSNRKQRFPFSGWLYRQRNWTPSVIGCLAARLIGSGFMLLSVIGAWSSHDAVGRIRVPISKTAFIAKASSGLSLTIVPLPVAPQGDL